MTATGSAYRRGPFREGDRVQLTDPKGRMHTITLTPGKQFHTHRGHVRHDDLISAPDGSTITNTATVNPPTGVTDPDLANNTGTAGTTVAGAAQVAVAKAAPATTRS